MFSWAGGGCGWLGGPWEDARGVGLREEVSGADARDEPLEKAVVGKHGNALQCCSAKRELAPKRCYGRSTEKCFDDRGGGFAVEAIVSGEH